ncbi:DUF6457 domain-containing protein [Streptomyces roseicoloratus]|uniref:DUF6457 domain-containing protein n=1 Tax=Streptomyces roseicoloratus TaxID=2508722 RepID=UPI001FECE58B|nr:DUF6457 domain-containing protein [Streptomyces roseicoloratus]
MTTAYDAIVLAGGAARRLGGADKPGVRVGGRPLLDRVLAACRDAGRVVVVAEPRATARPVEWAREDPPGGGPAAALDAGLRHLAGWADGAPATALGSTETSHPDAAGAAGAGPAATAASSSPAVDADHTAPSHLTEDTRASAPSASPAPFPAPATFVLVLSADLPFFEMRAARRLVRALEEAPGSDGAVMVDDDGREQPLVAVYRTAALRRELERVGPELGGLPLRRVVGGLRVERVAAEGSASFDCDTWEDIVTARARIREHGTVLDEWITAVKDELGIDLDVDTGLLLDLARDAAHGVARPAAPLTTFLVGYAAASAAGAGGGPEAVAEAARKAAALAQRWAAEQDEAG